MMSLWDLVRARLVSIALTGASIVLALAAAGYALRGLHQLLAESLGHVEASLVMSAAFLAIAVALGTFAFIRLSRRKREEARQTTLAKFVRQPVPLTARRLRAALRAALGCAVLAAGAAMVRLAFRRAMRR